jgi:hypothetical protein
MRKYASALILLLLPTVVLAQGEGRRGRRGGPSEMQRNVVQMIIEHKADLALSAEQVAQLEPIARKLDDENKPVVEELQKFRAAVQNPRTMSEQEREQVRTHMAKLRAHRESALTQVAAVLSADQQTKLRTLVRPRARGGAGLRRSRAG